MRQLCLSAIRLLAAFANDAQSKAAFMATSQYIARYTMLMVYDELQLFTSEVEDWLLRMEPPLTPEEATSKQLYGYTRPILC